MGSGLGWALRQGGARVVSTVDGRSARTARLGADLELLPALQDVVAAADVVLIVTPPGAAIAAARSVAAAARATGAPFGRRPQRRLARDDGVHCGRTRPARRRRRLDLGPPSTVRPGAALSFSGERADELVRLPWGGRARPKRIGDRVGSASALKMSTASVYKDSTASSRRRCGRPPASGPPLPL
jgi:hypothetical protein